MKFPKIIKPITIIIGTILVFSVLTGIFDWFRVKSFEKPIFTIPITADDGGSVIYYGLGYSINIKGNFMPEDELSGVTHYEYYIFGILADNGIRD